MNDVRRFAGEAADWSFSAPLPFVFNPLSFFSVNPSADTPINGVQGGFSFITTTDKNILRLGDFEVIGVVANTGSQIPSGEAVLSPSRLPCFYSLLDWQRLLVNGS